MVDRNTGNETLTGITVTDPLNEHMQVVSAMAVDACARLTDSYSNATAEQSAIDGNTSIVNTATATDSQGDSASTDRKSTRQNSSHQIITNSDTTTPTETDDASGASGVVDHAGQEIDYTIVVSNTGHATLTGITVTFPLTGPSPTVIYPLSLHDALPIYSYSNATAEQSAIDGNTSIVNTATATDSQGDSAS